MAGERTRRVIGKILSVLGRAYGRRKITADRPPLEELLLGILSDGTTERSAAMALGRLSDAFVDWNEVRVSSWCEIAAALQSLHGAEDKGRMIKAVLGKIFDRVNEMSLAPLAERSSREAARLIAGIEGFPEAALSRATIHGLGHTVVPLTPRVLSVCRRIDFAAGATDQKDILSAIEKTVPKHRMYDFHSLLSQHAVEVCHEKEPECPACKLLSECREGRERMRERKTSGAGRTRKKERKRSGR